MQKRIHWKKGMRLTDEIMRASSDAELELIGKALALGSVGRFGLFPGRHPFKVSLSIGRETVNVESLICLALTKEGSLIDVDYNTIHDKAFETRIPLPSNGDANELYLTIEILEGQWKETVNGYEEPSYQFRVVTPNSPIAGNALPIARLVNSELGGWHMDDLDFVPPCLFVSSHPKYADLHAKFQRILLEMSMKAQTLINSEAKNVMRTFWPLLQQITIATDKDLELMTPMMLLGLIQRVVCAFATSCELDEESKSLPNVSDYINYAFSPCNPYNVYQKAKDGVDLCFAISEKLDRIQTHKPMPEYKPQTATPSISSDQLRQNCRGKDANIIVTPPSDNATVFYSTDGSEPTMKLAGNSQIVIENVFQQNKAPEPDKNVTIKLKAIANGVSSETATYNVTLHKVCRAWDGYEI